MNRQSNLELDEIASMAGIGFWEMDVLTRKIFWSKETRRIHEVDDSYVPTYEKALDFYTPESRVLIRQAVDHAIQTGTRWSQELPFVTGRGRHIWVRTIGRPEYEHEKIIRLFGTFQDVTEEHTLRSQQELFFRYSIDMMCLAGTDGYFKKVNMAFEKVLGYSAEELCSRSFFEFIHPEDQEKTVKVLQSLMSGEPAVDFENRYRAADGTYRWLSWSAPAAEPGSTLIYAAARDVTQYREIQDKLLRSEKSFREMADSLDVMIWKTDDKQKFTYFNRRWTEFTGLTFDSLLGEGWLDPIHPEDRERVVHVCGTSFKSRESFDMDYRMRRQDGQFRLIRDHGAPRFDAEGMFAGFVGTCLDITDETMAREEIQKLALIARKTVNAVLLTGPEGLIEWVNEGFTRITGYTMEEAVGKKPGLLLQGPETDPRTVETLRRHIRRREPVRVEIVNYGKSGRPYWLDIEIQPIFNEAGALTHFMAIEQDITVRKDMEAMLRESEKHFKKLSLMARHTNNAVVLTDPSGVIEWVNEGFTRITGYGLREVIGRKPGAFLQGPESDRHAVETLRQAIRSEEAVKLEILNYTKSGNPFWFEIEIQPIRNETGELLHFMAVQQEITERKLLQKRLREGEEKIERILEASRMGVWEWNIDTHEVQWSEGTYRIFGRDPKQFVPDFNLILETIVEEDRDVFLQATNRAVKEAGVMNVEYRILHVGGGIRWVSAYGKVFCDALGKPVSMSGILSDITERKEMERKLVQEERLSLVGSLAGSVAHDFNNFMTGLNMLLNMMEMEKDPAGLEQLMKLARTAVEEASKLPRQLLSFSKGGNPVVTRVHPSMLREQADLCLVGSSIRLEWRETPGTKHLLADPGQMSQVISNLVINARQAMPLGGKVTIQCENVSLTGPARMHPLREGEYVQVSIGDQGSGIRPEELTRIFEPFYTTKKDGTGLGLATCRRIMQAHGGEIICESRLGIGTVFKLWIPVADRIMDDQADTGLLKPLKPFEGLVIIMDDDAIIATTVSKALEKMGVHALTVASGEECLEAYAHCLQIGNTVSLLILDITIRGGMGGVETLRRLLEKYPDIQAVAHSGYSESDAMNRYGEFGFVAALRKPTSFRDIQQLCERFLKPVPDGEEVVSRHP
ncbi:MAG: PAS domain S-box protein [Verrucomicrobiae bacterium]|nr:PAS domain S-box protein [Verrucomicrobiae bacterium]